MSNEANSSQMTMAELVKNTKTAYGMTWKEMGEQLGRSDRWVRKIANGETSGESFRQSLTELYDRGQVEHLTPRRRGKDGRLAKVRSKKGSSEKTVTPQDTRGTRVSSVRRGKFSHTVTSLPEGNRLHHIELPRSPRAAGRGKGFEALKESLKKVTRSQAHRDKRIKLKVVVEDENGVRTQYQIGSHSGYHASDIQSDIRTDFGGNAESWVSDQLDKVYEGLGSYTIVAIDMNEFGATRTKGERKAEDIAGTRRRRWGR